MADAEKERKLTIGALYTFEALIYALVTEMLFLLIFFMPAINGQLSVYASNVVAVGALVMYAAFATIILLGVYATDLLGSTWMIPISFIPALIALRDSISLMAIADHSIYDTLLALFLSFFAAGGQKALSILLATLPTISFDDYMWLMLALLGFTAAASWVLFRKRRTPYAEASATLALSIFVIVLNTFYSPSMPIPQSFCTVAIAYAAFAAPAVILAIALREYRQSISATQPTMPNS